MKGSEIFSGKSLKAEDIKGREPVVTIEKVTTQDFDDGKKPIIHFVGKDKTLVCNRTNWNSIVDITGEDDSDNWPGHKIRLVVARVDYQGKRVDAIRIDPPARASAPPPARPSRAQSRPDTGQADNMDVYDTAATAPDEDDIPF